MRVTLYATEISGGMVLRGEGSVEGHRVPILQRVEPHQNFMGVTLEQLRAIGGNGLVIWDSEAGTAELRRFDRSDPAIQG